MQKLMKQSIGSQVLRQSISSSVTIDLLKTSLIHDSARIRIVAFQTIPFMLPSLSEMSSQSALECLSMEIKLWNDSLPYVFNCADKEHMVVMNNSLHDLLLRISQVESDQDQNNKPLLKTFVNDLLNGLFIKQAYPGTTVLT